MTQEIIEIPIEGNRTLDAPEPLPFPFNQQTFCRYESIEKRIEAARVLVVDNLLRDEDDLSEVGHKEWGVAAAAQIKRERTIAKLAIENILNNISRLVKTPTTHVTHLAHLAAAVTGI